MTYARSETYYVAMIEPSEPPFDIEGSRVEGDKKPGNFSEAISLLDTSYASLLSACEVHAHDADYNSRGEVGTAVAAVEVTLLNAFEHLEDECRDNPEEHLAIATGLILTYDQLFTERLTANNTLRGVYPIVGNPSYASVFTNELRNMAAILVPSQFNEAAHQKAMDRLRAVIKTFYVNIGGETMHFDDEFTPLVADMNTKGNDCVRRVRKLLGKSAMMAQKPLFGLLTGFSL